MNIETKYSIGDHVHFMRTEKCREGCITSIHVTVEGNKLFRGKTVFDPDAKGKWKVATATAQYTVLSGADYLPKMGEGALFATKELLLQSL